MLWALTRCVIALNPCDARKKREAREALRAEKLAAREEKLAAWEKDRIA